MRENGVRRSLWLNSQLDELIEETRKRIGMSRSAFLKNATMRYLESISVITTKANQTTETQERNQPARPSSSKTEHGRPSLMSEHKIDFSKITDYEIQMLIIERNTCNYKVEQINELLNQIGESKGLKHCSTKRKDQRNNCPGSNALNELPWKSYKTKEKAEPTEAGWIFTKTEGAEALVATLKTNDGKAKIGNFEYQLQGPERQFIARKPVK